MGAPAYSDGVAWPTTAHDAATVTATSIPTYELLWNDGTTPSIDDPENLKDAPVYVIAGAADDVVPAGVAQQQYELYDSITDAVRTAEEKESR